MKPLYHFLIAPLGERYNNTVDVDGNNLIVNTEITERDFEFVNREAIVLETPRRYKGPIGVGDKLLVHHNVFRRWYDVRGNERNSASYFDEDKYLVTEEQIFAYYDTKWRSCEGFTFVFPIANDDDWDFELEKPLYGETLEGDLVGFTPNSEYEFAMDGKKVYRILSDQITWISKRNENKLSAQPN